MFFLLRSREGAFRAARVAVDRAVPEPSLNLGLITQNAQWLLLMGVSFVVSAYLQVVRGYNPIETGGIFTSVTVGICWCHRSARSVWPRDTSSDL